MSLEDETRDENEGDPVRRELDLVESLCGEFSRQWKDGHGQPVAVFLRAHGLDPALAPPGLVPELEKLEAWYQERRDTEEFAPGTVLAGRYRIEVFLGEGGMGKVYRAFDQALRKLVALKFLRASLAADPNRRAQFYNEVRSAQEVSHECVARVHDLGEHDGQPFLSMEYIDGGDLASLLRRSGRLTVETAAKYARQLCQGLAAVHKQGLIHRDLKPQNIMIDGRGQLRITDFGLAGEVGSFTGAAVRAGTPLYQSPEQLTGTEVSARSDIYSLGLVLYEMFTGKRAFEAASIAELMRLHQSGPVAPSSHVADLPLEVERVILKCLNHDPARRPSTAQVLTPLLRAGGTPTPEQIAEAEPEGDEVFTDGHTSNVSLRLALVMFALTLIGTLLTAWLNNSTALFRQAITDRAPRELSGKAREHLHKLGYGDTEGDSANGIATDERLVKDLRKQEPATLSRETLRAGHLPVMYFWYRHSPDSLAQRLAPNDTSGWSMPGRVLPNEPPLREPGMTCVFLDLQGRLLELHAIPTPNAAAREPDPRALLEAAGFRDGTLHESKEFHRVPPVFADKQMAWEGCHPDLPEMPVRVEAAFHRGWPVYFYVGSPKHPDRLPGFMPDNVMEKLQEVKNTLLGLVALPIGGWFAWRNWTSKPRRANPRGASIVAGSFVALGMLGWLLAAHHALWPKDKLGIFKDELSMFTGMLGRALFDGLLLWLAYLALEPLVRRIKPESVISWNRLLLGQWRDPLVGHHILVGIVFSVGFVTLALFLRSLPGWLGGTPDSKIVWDATFTEGTGSLLITVQIGLMVAFRSFFLLVLTLLICQRRLRLAVGLNVAIWWVMYAHGGDYLPVACVVGLAFALASLLVLFRAGLLGFVAFTLVEQVLIYMPVTIDFSAWYAEISTLSQLFVAGLATYGFWIATGRALRGQLARG